MAAAAILVTGPRAHSVERDQQLVEPQVSITCPSGECPGLGRAFYLPEENGFAPKTGGVKVFDNTRLGACARLTRIAGRDTKQLETSRSMEQFVSNTAAKFNLSATHTTTSRLTLSVTAQATTGSSSSIIGTFHSSTVDIARTTHVVDFEHDSSCFGADNLDDGYLKLFESLPPIKDNVGGQGAWKPYEDFLKNGSHIMMAQELGSRFQLWQSTTSSERDVQRTLEAKTCLRVDGRRTNVEGCVEYSAEERKRAESLSAVSRQIVLGGSETGRTALTQNVTTESLNAFIASAAQGTEPIRFRFKPVWELFVDVYRRRCRVAGSSDCDNLQRAYNLQAAYEGWTAVACRELKDGRGVVYQTMAVGDRTAQGINTYVCRLSKTGCGSHNDCHYSASSAGCFCHGQGCIDQGEPVAGTTTFRNRVRGRQEGTMRGGVNSSCGLKGFKCYCDVGWPGGLPERLLYQQGS